MVVERDWALRMVDVLSQPGVAIVGARIVPRWRGRQSVLTLSGVVVDQYSMLDLGAETKRLYRIVGASLGVRKTAVPDRMYFDASFGHRPGKLFGGDEADLCRRVSAAMPDSIVYGVYGRRYSRLVQRFPPGESQ